MSPEQCRRLRALLPMEGVLVDYDRAKRLFDATPVALEDAGRVEHVKGVLRMLADPKPYLARER